MERGSVVVLGFERKNLEFLGRKRIETVNDKVNVGKGWLREINEGVSGLGIRTVRTAVTRLTRGYTRCGE